MSLVILVALVIVVAGICIFAMMPDKTPAPLAHFRAAKGTRVAELLLYPDNKYEIKCTQDGENAALDTGSYRQEGKSGGDGTVLFLTAADGKERQMVFDKGLLHTFSETEDTPAARSIALLDFERKV